MVKQTKPRILVVDDDPVVCATISEFLEECGHDYICAGSCAETPPLLQGEPFACAIVDLQLEDGDGLSLLPAIRESSPSCVPIVLTKDGRADTIVGTMREGVFDYLIKPVGYDLFRAALSRALHHHAVAQERDRLLEDLKQERSSLQERVAAANEELRDQVKRVELVNARQQVLLKLNMVSDQSYTEDDLFRSLFTELAAILPLRCIALGTSHGSEYCISVSETEDGQVAVVESESPADGPGKAVTLGAAELHAAIRKSIERRVGLDTRAWAASVYPQRSLGRVFCAVAFFLPDDYVLDFSGDAFLEACASTLTAKWQDLRLFQYAARQASVGNLVLDLSRELVQELTAIRMAADVVLETHLSPEAAEGMRIISENSEDLRRTLQDLRQLPPPGKKLGETLCLGDLADRTLELLSSTIENRQILVKKDYRSPGQCILMNGSALSNVFLDLFSSILRSLQDGEYIAVTIRDNGPNTALFEIAFSPGQDASGSEGRRAVDMTAPSSFGRHPKFVMAQRTVRSCGGTLSVEHKDGGRCAFNIVLPRNSFDSRRELEEIGLS